MKCCENCIYAIKDAYSVNTVRCGNDTGRFAGKYIPTSFYCKEYKDEEVEETNG